MMLRAPPSSMIARSAMLKMLCSSCVTTTNVKLRFSRAMALGCDILLLDEPSAGLDPITAANLDRTILTLRENLGFTFVVVTHELHSIFNIADRAIMLDPVSRSIIAE